MISYRILKNYFTIIQKTFIYYAFLNMKQSALVVELVDTKDLKPCLRSAGSSPAEGTKANGQLLRQNLRSIFQRK